MNLNVQEIKQAYTVYKKSLQDELTSSLETADTDEAAKYNVVKTTFKIKGLEGFKNLLEAQVLNKGV